MIRARARARWPLAYALMGALLATALLAACGSSSSPTDTAGEQGIAAATDITVEPPGDPQPGGTVSYAIEAESDGFDPTASRFAPSTLLVGNAVFDPIMAFDANNEAKPYLVETAEHNEDYTVWTLGLRPGISFHNGEPLDAAAIKKFIDALRESVLTKSAARPIDEVVVVDPLTVRIELNTPWVAFPAIATGQAGMVAAPAMLDDPEGSRNPIGTGPFVFEEWKPDTSMRLVRNDSYWRSGLPYLDGIEFQPTPDIQSRKGALQSGDVNMAHFSDAATIGQLEALALAGDLQLIYSTGETEENLLMVNVNSVTDIRVRQAMAHGLDKAALREVMGTEAVDDATGPWAKDSPWYHETAYPAYDPERARQLVAEVEAESGPISIRLGSPPAPESTQATQLIGQQWQDIGIDVAFDSLDQTTYIANAVQGKYDVYIWRQFGSPDPDSDGIFWHSDQTEPPIMLNMAGNRDAELDAALDEGRTSPDPAVRKAAYQKVTERLTATLPYLWISHLRWAVATDLQTFGVADQTLPDGTPSAGVRGGVHRMTEVWHL